MRLVAPEEDAHGRESPSQGKKKNWWRMRTMVQKEKETPKNRREEGKREKDPKVYALLLLQTQKP